ncbi:ankyrin repeat-containing domain protein [Aspergillus pseudoustus]|uniref:Ankyrin repeat-containing domain protein n=1 Tax=Aspergillus pseudoustus TaxID=1810923 RepID=A0ABR4IAB9_9EURO
MIITPRKSSVSSPDHPPRKEHQVIWACMSSSPEAVWLLIKYRVPYRPLDRLRHEGITETFIYTPIFHATKNPDPGPLQVILHSAAYGDPRTIDYHGAECNISGYAQQALERAVKRGNIPMIEALLRQGANVNFSYPKLGPPLIIAVNEGHFLVVGALLGYGADVRISGLDRWTALHWAAAKGHEEVAEVILDARANVNSDASMVRLLIQRGTSIHHLNRLGRSALSIAAAIDAANVTEWLMNHGADSHQVCGSGRTTLFYAIGGGSRESAFYTQRNPHLESDMRRLAEILGYELTGNLEHDAYNVQREFKSCVKFDMFDTIEIGEEEV